MTEKSLLSHFRVTLVTFESLSGLLWGGPRKSLLCHFFVSLIVLGFGGFCGARRVTIQAAFSQKTREGCGCPLAGKGFPALFDAAGQFFPDFPATTNAIDAKACALSSKGEKWLLEN